MRIHSVTLAIGMALLLSPLAFAGPSADEVIDAFVKAVGENDAFSKEQAQAALDAADALREDDYTRPLAITTGLRSLYPEYGQALAMLADEDISPAIAILQELSKSDDPFLAADATFYLARGYAIEERYETALPLLDRVVGELSDKTLQTGEAVFLQGIAQSRLLKRKEAIETLAKFEEQYPDAPERMRIAAWRERQILERILAEEGSLADVFDHMEFSRIKLAGADTGEGTQEKQEDIIAMLEKLIKQAEESECNCSGGGSGQGQGQGQNGGGEGEGMGGDGSGQNDQSQGATVRRTYRGPRSPWGALRDKERDPAYSAIKGKFDPRYEHLLEQYYKHFQTAEE